MKELAITLQGSKSGLEMHLTSLAPCKNSVSSHFQTATVQSLGAQ